MTGTSTRYVALVQADGQWVTLRGDALNAFTKGTLVEASGRRAGNALFVTNARSLSPGLGSVNKATAVAQGQAMQAQGTLMLAHADDFATGRSNSMLNVQDAAGTSTSLKVAVLPNRCR